MRNATNICNLKKPDENKRKKIGYLLIPITCRWNTTQIQKISCFFFRFRFECFVRFGKLHRNEVVVCMCEYILFYFRVSYETFKQNRFVDPWKITHHSHSNRMTNTDSTKTKSNTNENPVAQTQFTERRVTFKRHLFL